MFSKKNLLALSILPIVISCSLPLSNSNSSIGLSLVTKADAIKYFECALNRPGISDDEKNKIKTLVISQINLIPDIAWEKAKAGFESYAKLYGCNSLAPSASPTSSQSPSSVPSTNSASSTSMGILSSKEEYIKYLQCIYNSLKTLTDTKDTSVILSGIEVYSELNATRYLDDKTFEQQKPRFEALITKYKKYCDNPNAVPTTAPTFTPIKTVNNVAEYSCDAEKTLKSSSGDPVNLKFINGSGGKVKIYWLDYSGNRKIYNNSLANSATHPQSTFVTHPWLVTDENDKCLKIYLPQSKAASVVNINFM